MSHFMQTKCNSLDLVKLGYQVVPLGYHREHQNLHCGAKPKAYSNRQDHYQGNKSSLYFNFKHHGGGEKEPSVMQHKADKPKSTYSNDKHKEERHNYSASIKQDLLPSHPVRLIIPVLINDHMVDGLVDSGVDTSTLRYKETELLSLYVTPWSGETIVAVGNESLPLGEAIVKVKMANTSILL